MGSRSPWHDVRVDRRRPHGFLAAIDDVLSVAMKPMPMACSLDGAALARRQTELASSLLADAVRTEALSDGYRWQFRSSDGLLGRLAAVIDAERQCCRFLRFALNAEPDLGVVTLEVTGPTGSREFLESWLPDSPGTPR